MRTLVTTVLLLTLCVAGFAQGHFHFAGPMSQFLPEGGVPGTVTGGLPFAVVLTDAGATLAPTSFDFQPEGWEGKATLTLADVKFADGRLTATVRLSNDTKAPLEGLRLDITGATEEYKAKDDQGQDILKTRAQAVGIASPLLLGDVAKRDSADPQPLDAGPIVFQPETTKITVTGVLSGLYYAGMIKPPVDAQVFSLDFDPQGRLNMALRAKNDLYRCDPDGQNAVPTAKLPKYAPGNMAVDPLNGDLLATSYAIYRFSADGAPKEVLSSLAGPTADRLRGYGRVIRFDPKGNLYVGDDAFLACYFDNQRLWAVDRIGEYRFNSGLVFDVDREGKLWVADAVPSALYTMGRKGEGARRVTAGADWHLGAITEPRAVRIDAHGNVYVVEGSINKPDKKEVQRVSVFDAQGRIVRVFGRADRSPAKTGLMEGQLSPLASDLAFGPDGRIFLANSNMIMIFRPF
ncbi:MAG TPA: hypothetical protein VGM19_08795 [Armatimonadota bacterium]|jgi:DNA-binding beta-propeller fold protein YncE